MVNNFGNESRKLCTAAIKAPGLGGEVAEKPVQKVSGGINEIHFCLFSMAYAALLKN